MRIHILTLFPEVLTPYFSASIVSRAQTHRKVEIRYVQIRDYGISPHKTVDDRPYGGGAGMVLRVDVVDKAISQTGISKAGKNSRIVLLTPQGNLYNQTTARKYVLLHDLVLICGRYEGFDERIRTLVDEEVSIGDYVLTGGELAAAVIADSVVRLLPGVLKKDEASVYESFSVDNSGKQYIEYPQYTRPSEYKGMNVPEILLSGNHEEIQNWKLQQSIERTKKRRPDLT